MLARRVHVPAAHLSRATSSSAKRAEFCLRAEKIASKFAHVRMLKKTKSSGGGGALHDVPSERASAVLAVLLKIDGKDHLLFTKRSSLLAGHRGEVCLPGGRQDEGETLQQAAYRETWEEIGLPSDSLTPWTELRPMLTRNLNAMVTPFVASLDSTETGLSNVTTDDQRRRFVNLPWLNINPSEVAAVFSVPIDELIQSVRRTTFHDDRHKFHYTLPVYFSQRYVLHYTAPSLYIPSTFRVWGLTATMLHQFLLCYDPSRYRMDIEFPV